MVKKYKFSARGGPASGWKETKKTPYQSKHGTGQADRAREEIKGLGDLPLVGGLVKGLGKFIDLVEKVEEAGGEIKKRGEIKGKEGVKGIYGFSIRTGIGERPKIQTFGNIHPTKVRKAKPKIKITEEREPIIDVFNEKNHVLIVAELPGVEKESIKLDFKGDILTLEAGDEKRKYAKEILLPAKVDPRTKEISYNHGVLEIKIKKSLAVGGARKNQKK